MSGVNNGKGTLRSLGIRTALVGAWTFLSAGPSWAQDEMAESFTCADVPTLIADATEEELRDPKLHFRSSKLYFSQAQQGESALFVKAARSAMLAAHLDPGEPEYHMRVGLALAELECWDAAGAAFGRSRTLAANDEKMEKKLEEISNNIKYYWTGRFNLAIEKMDEEDLEGAAEAFASAIAIDSTDARAYANLGVAYQRLERYQEAVETFEHAIARDPDNESARTNYRKTNAFVARDRLSSALGETGEAKQAALQNVLVMYEDVMAQSPPDGEIAEYKTMMGGACRMLGEEAETPEARNRHLAAAIEHYRTAAEARYREAATAGETPLTLRTDPEYLTQILSCFVESEAWDSTSTYAQQLVDLDPREYRGYHFIGEALRNTEQSKEALTYFLVMQCLNPDQSEAVGDVNNHFVGLLGRYQPTDDIVTASIENLESPSEIRVARTGEDTSEAWFFWEKGYVDCYYNGASQGRVDFRPVAVEDDLGSAVGQ